MSEEKYLPPSPDDVAGCPVCHAMISVREARLSGWREGMMDAVLILDAEAVTESTQESDLAKSIRVIPDRTISTKLRICAAKIRQAAAGKEEGKP